MQMNRTTGRFTHFAIAVLALLACAAARATELQISTEESAHNEPPPVADAKAFADGKVFYHAVPTTPAVGRTYKIINTSNDTDYVIKVYKLKNTNVVYEIRGILYKTVSMAGGNVSTYIDVQTLEESLTVTAPDYAFPYIEEAIKIYDKPGTDFSKSGSKRLWYVCKNRKATEMADILKSIGTSASDIVVDDRINMIMVKDSPSIIKNNIEKYLPYWDIAPQMVRIDAQIIECEADNDFNFGLALEAWKEALPERVDTVLAFNQAKTSLAPGVDTSVKGALESINVQGMRPKAAANFINYLIRTGKAKVLSCPTAVAINGQQATISSIDNVSYKSYTDTSTSAGKLSGKMAGTGVSLTITPTIGDETLTLAINANVNSLVSWAAGNEPIINTRTVTANIVLKDGEPFTMSGLKRDTIAKEDERVPILGSCPLIGYAFRHEIDVKKTTEIVVLLTPHRVSPSTSVMDRERELLQSTQEAVNKRDERTGMQTFYDRVIRNSKE